ncbi:3-hydroxyisobutyrate dehydrogenase 1 [Spatholobus suberectus]|nr:3-hydroxyisobutyrate dehydrogenase 1 [Spatholobus suberectus]
MGTPYPTPISPSEIRIGWIGIGVMGFAMASRLVSAGYTLSFYARNPSHPNALSLQSQGASLAHSPAQLAQSSDVLFTMLPPGPRPPDLLRGARPRGVVRRRPGLRRRRRSPRREARDLRRRGEARGGVAGPAVLDSGEGDVRGPRGVRAELQDREPDHDRGELDRAERGAGVREARGVGSEGVRGGDQGRRGGFQGVGVVWGEDDGEGFSTGGFCGVPGQGFGDGGGCRRRRGRC